MLTWIDLNVAHRPKESSLTSLIPINQGASEHITAMIVNNGWEMTIVKNVSECNNTQLEQ